ncbi:putative ribosome production factor 1 [Lucilia cuprina]|uniref:Putative ribosome production factor 1 n=1 Tax=Lucilia cuprina TaxID=7375 RepID=A0A0L0C6C4_LUCCU|nr:putative ribosome production factor 1 [Lucilia cuprina]KAI8124925.1 putative ribosome production factor 1 [Lucilia cuprina]KNC27370.1 putative ribosome production factor 1 [Lucilia cuprina]KNC27830.1 putative ribosome production factor 1 [Lucilia cuprina]
MKTKQVKQKKPIEPDSDSSFEEEDDSKQIDDMLADSDNDDDDEEMEEGDVGPVTDSSDGDDEDMDDEKPTTSKNARKLSANDKSNKENDSSEGEDDGDDDDDDDDEEDDKEPEVRMPIINPLSLMRNKEQRTALFRKMKKEKHKKKMQERRARRKAGVPRNPGHTIESLREKDQTTVNNLDDSDNEELRKELQLDDFSSYFERTYEPKVLITFADNPVTKTRKFGLELGRIFPNALVKIRNKSSVKKICKSAIREEYTDVVIVNEDRRKPNGLLVIHLPNGPTALFKVSNVKLTSDMKRDHKEITKHRPEVILNNFTTRLGLTVGRMLGALFHHDPEFKGRRAVTFHNQRDYIFFRHHRYEFTKEGKRVKLRELGPRFTLKLRSLQEGTFDSKTGDYAWIITNKRHALEASRRRFHL